MLGSPGSGKSSNLQLVNDHGSGAVVLLAARQGLEEVLRATSSLGDRGAVMLDVTVTKHRRETAEPSVALARGWADSRFVVVSSRSTIDDELLAQLAAGGSRYRP